MDSRSGTYALVLSCVAARPVQIGRLGELQVRPGFYIYVGSAFGPGGIRARVAHHERQSPRPRWHIDYLGGCTALDQVWYSYDSQLREHQWAHLIQRARGASAPLSGFGSSDCDCESHLYFFAARPSVMGFSRRLHRAQPDHAALRRGERHRTRECSFSL